MSSSATEKNDQPFYLSNYTDTTRIVLTASLLLVAVGFLLFGGRTHLSLYMSGIATVLGLLAYQAENWIQINVRNGSYVLYRLIKPYGMPVVGPLSSIHSIQLGLRTTNPRLTYDAKLVFDPSKRHLRSTFPIRANSPEELLEIVVRLARTTKIPVVLSDQLKVAWHGFEGIAELVDARVSPP